MREEGRRQTCVEEVRLILRAKARASIDARDEDVSKREERGEGEKRGWTRAFYLICERARTRELGAMMNVFRGFSTVAFSQLARNWAVTDNSLVVII